MSTDVSSYLTTTTNYNSAKRIKWETELLAKAEGELVAERYATTKVMGKGEAGTYRINKLLRAAKKTTADTEGYLYSYADAKTLSTNYIDITPVEYGDSFTFSDDVGIEAFVTDQDNQQEIANQFARSMEYLLLRTIATGGMRWRIDKDSSYMVTGTVDSATTTTLVDDALTQADDYWNNGYVTITNPEGPAYDTTSKITDFVAATDTATVAFTVAPTSSSKYIMTTGTGIVASDVLTTSALLDVRARHGLLETEPFAGNTLQAFIHRAQERDLWDDTTWANSAIYDDSGRFRNYEMVRWAGINFHVASELYREDADGTENQSSGAVYFAPIFGRKAYSVIRWGMGMGSFGVKWLYKDRPDTSDLRDKFHAISWKCKYGSAVTRATSVINLMTGATDLNLLTI